jgi:hypothetical protein
MTFPISVDQTNGEFVAALVGNATMQAARPTREAAIVALQSVLASQVAAGRLAMVEIPKTGVMALFGKYADDPTLDDICEEAYRERDLEPKE